MYSIYSTSPCFLEFPCPGRQAGIPSCQHIYSQYSDLEFLFCWPKSARATTNFK